MYDKVNELKLLKTPTNKLIYVNYIDALYNKNDEFLSHIDFVKRYLKDDDPLQKDIKNIIEDGKASEQIIYIAGFFNSGREYTLEDPTGALIRKSKLKDFFNDDFINKPPHKLVKPNEDGDQERKVGDLDLTKLEGFGTINFKCIISKMKELLPELKYVFLNPSGNYQKEWLVKYYKSLGFETEVCSILFDGAATPSRDCDSSGGNELLMFAKYDVLLEKLTEKIKNNKNKQHVESNCGNIYKGPVDVIDESLSNNRTIMTQSKTIKNRPYYSAKWRTRIENRPLFISKMRRGNRSQNSHVDITSSGGTGIRKYTLRNKKKRRSYKRRDLKGTNVPFI
jgi:hypothetical protein